jgi:hypothetical protein
MDHTPETTPDQLLDTFRGRGLKTIILFTIVAHAVILLGTSAPYLWRSIIGKDTSTLSEDERVNLAMKEATSSLRKIAEAHGLRPQDLASRLEGGAPRAPQGDAAPKPAGKAVEPAPTTAEPEPPKSEIQKEIEKVKEGPVTPPVEEDVDLFR